MFELAWKEIHPNGNQPIRQKSFRTAERRQDFIDSFPDGDIRFEITSMSAEDSHTISDFHTGMRVNLKEVGGVGIDISIMSNPIAHFRRRADL